MDQQATSVLLFGTITQCMRGIKDANLKQKKVNKRGLSFLTICICRGTSNATDTTLAHQSRASKTPAYGS